MTPTPQRPTLTLVGYRATPPLYCSTMKRTDVKVPDIAGAIRNVKDPVDRLRQSNMCIVALENQLALLREVRDDSVAKVVSVHYTAAEVAEAMGVTPQRVNEMSARGRARLEAAGEAVYRPGPGGRRPPHPRPIEDLTA